MNSIYNLTAKYQLLKVFIAFIFFLLFFSQRLYSAQGYDMSLQNGNLIDEHTFEFEVYVKSTEADFTLSSYQCAFTFNTGMINGGILTLNYVDGSSELNNVPQYSIGCVNIDGTEEFSFASFIGSDLIGSQQIRVGKFRIENSSVWGSVTPDIAWNFDGIASTIITGDGFEDITVINNHFDLTYSQLLITGLDPDLPLQFKLEQNYPNPFNPSTKIKFSLPQEDFVKIKVYNSIGQEIIELVNNQFLPGTYEVNFEGNNLVSGVYIYRIETSTNVEAKKMMLIK